MSEDQRFDTNDLALYAMQLLLREEAVAASNLLDSSPSLRRELAEVQGDLAMYATTVDLHTPPAFARERLLAQIGRETKVRQTDYSQDFVDRVNAGYGAGPGTSITGGEPSLDQTAALLTDDDLPGSAALIDRLLPWAGWAIAAGLAITTGLFYHENQAMRGSMVHDHAELARLSADAAAARQLMEALKDPSATRVTLTRNKEALVSQGKVIYVADRGSLIFIASNLDPLDTYKVYELWLIPVEGQPVPAGTFHPDSRGNASVVLPSLAPGLTAKAFGVTIEDEGGSQTPTMPIILAGSATGA